MFVARRYQSTRSIQAGTLSYFIPIPFLILNEAACYNNGVDPDAFFPYPHRTNSENKMAKKICKDCPVINECLEYALENNEVHGIWGGMSPKERQLLKRKRARDAEVYPAPVGGNIPPPNWGGIEKAV
jgi:WhiB family transcriptional regulator, redox-sensing transcriptional regulator